MMSSQQTGANQPQEPNNITTTPPCPYPISQLLPALLNPVRETRTYDEGAFLRGQGLVPVTDLTYMLPRHALIHDSDAKIILIIGGPGAGKSTVAASLAAELNIVHIDAAAVVRKLATTDSKPVWKMLCKSMEASGVLPSTVLVNVIRLEIFRNQGFGQNVFIVDGFPQTRDEFDRVDDTYDIIMALHLLVAPDAMEKRYMQVKMIFQEREPRLARFNHLKLRYSALVAELTGYEKFNRIMANVPGDAEFSKSWPYIKSLVETRSSLDTRA